MPNISSIIAKRYFFSRTKTRFLPFLTVIAIAGVALGTCAMVVILSVMNGFNEELEKRLLGFNAHIVVTSAESSDDISSDRLRQLIGVDRTVDVTPFVDGEVIVEAEIGDELLAQGARLKGMNPGSMGMMKNVEYYFPKETTASRVLSEGEGEELPAIILGRDILGQLNVHPDFADTIEVIAPLADVGPTGEMEPRLKRFVLAGYFVTGIYEYDTLYALVNIDQARNVLGAQTKSGWQIRIDDPHDAPEIAAQLQKELGDGFKVEGWHERNRKLFAALKLERLAMGGVLILVVLIASFSVIGVIMMIVSSKRRDVALLQSLGMKRISLKGVFLRQGMWIGLVGVLIGCAVGVLICFLLEIWPIRLPQSYYLETLAVKIQPVGVVLVALVGVTLAMLSSLYPVSTATKDDPAVVLRYE